MSREEKIIFVRKFFQQDARIIGKRSSYQYAQNYKVTIIFESQPKICVSPFIAIHAEKTFNRNRHHVQIHKNKNYNAEQVKRESSDAFKNFRQPS